MRLQACPASSFCVVYTHILPDGRETWATKTHDCSYDWEGRAWRADMIKPGDFAKTADNVGNMLSRGKGCRPEGMVIACTGNEFLVLWHGDVIATC